MFTARVYFVGVLNFYMLGKIQCRDKPVSTCVTKVGPSCVLVKFVRAKDFKSLTTLVTGMFCLYMIGEK